MTSEREEVDTIEEIEEETAWVEVAGEQVNWSPIGEQDEWNILPGDVVDGEEPAVEALTVDPGSSTPPKDVSSCCNCGSKRVRKVLLLVPKSPDPTLDDQRDDSQNEVGERLLGNEASVEEESGEAEGGIDGAVVKIRFCSRCNFSCSGEESLGEHVRKVHPESVPPKVFRCSRCDYSTPKKQLLKAHLVTHTGEKRFACGQCDFRTAHSNALKDHMMKHSGERPWACRFCDYRAPLRKTLKFHEMKHTGKPFPCTECKHRAISRAALKYHMKTHTGEKHLSCDKCDYKTTTRSNLWQHKLRLHKGEKKYKCPHCNFASYQSWGLRVHLPKHTGEKPFPCKACPFAAKSLYLLKVHKAIVHPDPDNKVYTCTQCSYSTPIQRNLNIHIKTHTKPFECPKCIYRTACATALKKHEAKHF